MKTVFLILLTATLGCAQDAALKPGLYAIFSTSKGDITAELYEKYTPMAVANFAALAQGAKPWLDPSTGKMVRRPLYDHITFHRVVHGAMIQSGDPTATGRHNCGVRIRDEILPGLTFNRAGRLAVANTGEPDSGGCQFFITDGQMPEWNGKYTIFGQVVKGQEVVAEINRVPLRGDRPVDPVMLNSVSTERIAAPKR